MPVLQRTRLGNSLAVDIRAVERAQVLDQPGILLAADLRVLARGMFVAQHNVVVAAATERDRFAGGQLISRRQRLAFLDRQLRTHNIAHKLRAESAAERCKNWDSHCGWAGTQALRSKFTFSTGVRNVGSGKKVMFGGPFVAPNRNYGNHENSPRTAPPAGEKAVRHPCGGTAVAQGGCPVSQGCPV